MHHLVLEDEAPAELEEMTGRLMAEVAPKSEIEARLARRLAIAFWNGPSWDLPTQIQRFRAFRRLTEQQISRNLPAMR